MTIKEKSTGKIIECQDGKTITRDGENGQLYVALERFLRTHFGNTRFSGSITNGVLCLGTDSWFYGCGNDETIATAVIREFCLESVYFNGRSYKRFCLESVYFNWLKLQEMMFQPMLAFWLSITNCWRDYGTQQKLLNSYWGQQFLLLV